VKPPRTPAADQRQLVPLYILVIGLGCLARLRGLTADNSLWLDELFIANNLMELDWPGLLGPLNHGQNAPVGWLFAQKAMATLFGYHEGVLRFISFLASVLSLPLTAIAAGRALGWRAAIIPLVLVSFSPFVVWQSFQLKQYSLDLLATLLILNFSQLAIRKGGRWTSLLSLSGVVLVFFSMPVIFVLAGTGFTLLLRHILFTGEGRNRSIMALGLTGTAWISAFMVNYLLFLRPGEQAAWLYGFWQHGFFPLREGWVDQLQWVPVVIVRAFENPMGFMAIGLLTALPFVFGSLRIPFEKDLCRRLDLTTCAASIAFTFLAACIQQYPFSSRLILFLVPCMAIVMGYGLQELHGLWPRWRRVIQAATAAAVAVPAAILLLWIFSGKLPAAADSRSLFETLHSVRQPGEAVVIDPVTAHAWQFYGDPRMQAVHLPDEGWQYTQRIQAVRAQLKSVKTSTAWVAFTEVGKNGPLPLMNCLRLDVADRAFSFPRTLQSITQGLRSWAPVEDLEKILPDGWVIGQEFHFRGAVLFRVVSSPETAG
jgi:hypothetical protein